MTLSRPLRCLLATLALAPLAASAQHLTIKAGGGLASHYGPADVVGAYKIGVGYEYEFDQHWTFAPSVVFYGKGWKDPDVTVPDINDDTGQQRIDASGNLLYSVKDRSTAACYVEVPLTFNYYFRLGESRYIVVGAGPYLSYGVAGKTKVKGDGEAIESQKLYYDYNTFGGTDGLRRFDFGLQALAGYQFPSAITVGLEADFGLQRVKADGGRNFSALIAFTYTFK